MFCRLGAVSSVVERLVYTEDVGSSTLSPPTISLNSRENLHSMSWALDLMVRLTYIVAIAFWQNTLRGCSSVG